MYSSRLEALRRLQTANGVACVQPDHGAFPEVLGHTGGGVLFEPNNPAHLAERLEAFGFRNVSLRWQEGLIRLEGVARLGDRQIPFTARVTVAPAGGLRLRLTLDRWRLQLPALGPIFHQFALSEFCRSLSTLLSGGGRGPADGDGCRRR